MICQRCGYCCTNLLCVIVIDPEKGIDDIDNLRGLDQLKERCPHLTGDKPGEYGCAVHHYPWFKETGCGRHNEHYPEKPCVMGVYIVDKEKT